MWRCASPKYDFAKTLGFDKRTIGNAERGTHPPSHGLCARQYIKVPLEEFKTLTA